MNKFNWSKNRTNHQNEDLPPLYPNGWTAVLESTDLKKGQIKAVFAFGKDLVVCRGQSGKCYAFDAYCPHLGANLGVGGTVSGESVQCPFHGWVYNEEGKCTQIPGVDREFNKRFYLNFNINQFIIRIIFSYQRSQM